MWQYPTFNVDGYLLDLTEGDNILYNMVRKELEYKHINFIVSNSAPKEGRICLFTYLMNKYGSELFWAKLDHIWHISISFKLAIIFLKDPKQILGIEMEQLTSTAFTDMLYELKGSLHGTLLERFVNDIKSKKEQEQLQLAWEKDKEQVELKRKKEQEQLELERKKEQEQLKLQQKQLKKEKEDNEKKLKQSKIDTIVSYFF